MSNEEKWVKQDQYIFVQVVFRYYYLINQDVHQKYEGDNKTNRDVDTNQWIQEQGDNRRISTTIEKMYLYISALVENILLLFYETNGYCKRW